MNNLDSGALDRTALAALITISGQAAEGDITGPEARERLLNAARVVDEMRQIGGMMSNKPGCPKCKSNAYVDGPYGGYWNWYCDDCEDYFHVQSETYEQIDHWQNASPLVLESDETHEQKSARITAAMVAGDISPVIWEARLATAARAELARTGEREVTS